MINSWPETILVSMVLAVLVYILMKVSRLVNNQELKARDIKKGHHWNYNDPPFPVSHCNICDQLIISTSGAFCEACGVCVDEADCVTEANLSLPCKAISTKSPLKHHFVKGHLHPDTLCFVCDKECESYDVRCCWCQRCVHGKCLKKFGDVCDLGKLKKFIVPPTHVKLMADRLRKQLIVEEVSLPNIDNWSPVIVIGNSSAGSNDCEHILPAFRLLLNSAQVVDLSKKKPEEALGWCRLLPLTTCRIIVAGGDGTVGWVFNTIHKLKLKNVPLVSILPLGTGNDLSRVLGWGDGHTGTINAQKFLRELDHAKPNHLDRWNVSFKSATNIGLPLLRRVLYMNNYLSIGVDALVTLNFHRLRQSPFYLIQHRLINKLIYFSYGTKDVLMQECRDLQDKVEVWMDGNKVDLPCFESLVVLNIPCWGAGVLPWKMGVGGQKVSNQKIDDQTLEVFCVNSSFHIAKLQMGVTEPVRIGQCKSIDIRLKGKSPMQVDGEPWEQSPGLLSISYSHSAKVLSS